MSHAKLVVDKTWDQPALVGDHLEFHGESSMGVTESCAWLVTMEDFGLGVEVLESGDHSQKGNVAGGKVEVDLSLGLACHFGELFTSDPLEKGFGDVRSADVPTIPDSFRDY